VIHLLGQAAEAATFLDKLLDLSPVLAVLAAVIFGQMYAMLRMNAANNEAHLASSERERLLGEKFSEVMSQNSDRNFQMSETRERSSTELAAALARLQVVIESLAK